MLQRVLDSNYRIWGVDAVYQTPVGAVKNIRLIRSEPDDLTTFGQTTIKTTTHFFNVRKTEIPAPAAESTITLVESGDVYRVKNSVAINKSERLEFQLSCYEERS